MPDFRRKFHAYYRIERKELYGSASYLSGQIFFSNPKENHVSFELSLFLPDRHILGESQRIEPGQYVQTIIGLRILPEVSQYENCILQYCCYLPQSRTPCKVCEYSVSVNFTS